MASPVLPSYDVVVIGGGVSGTSVVNNLVSKWIELKKKKAAVTSDQQETESDNTKSTGGMLPQLNINWFESSESFGPGLCWGEGNSDVQLFNLPAGVASIVQGEFGTFVGYCKETAATAATASSDAASAASTLGSIEFYSYPPRNTFGGFLTRSIERLVSLAVENGIHIEMRAGTKVIDVVKQETVPNNDGIITNNRFSIKWEHVKSSSNGNNCNTAICDTIFVCTGPASKVNPLFSHLKSKEKVVVEMKESLSTGEGSKAAAEQDEVSGRYIPTPWPCSVLDSIPSEARVAVIGTGLTAVDVVKHLQYVRSNRSQLAVNNDGGGDCNQETPKHGMIYMTSRKGLLPTIKTRANNPFLPLKFATHPEVSKLVEENGGTKSKGLLALFMDLIRQEMEYCIDIFISELTEDDKAAVPEFTKEHFKNCLDQIMNVKNDDGASFESLSHDFTVELLKNNLATVSHGKRLPWQDCFIALGMQNIIPTCWYHLCDEEKHSFMKKYGTLLQVYTNSMPESSGYDILSFIERKNESGELIKGNLRIVPQFQKVELTENSAVDGTFNIYHQSKEKDGGSDSPIVVDYVINATGFGKHFSADNVQDLPAFIVSMLGKKMVVANSFGGLNCEFNSGLLNLHDIMTTTTVDSTGTTTTNSRTGLLYGVGHVISGEKLITSSLGACVNDAGNAVTDLMKRVEASL